MISSETKNSTFLDLWCEEYRNRYSLEYKLVVYNNIETLYEYSFENK